jgi:hypothetical protein
MDLELLRSRAVLNSRVEPAKPLREYYQFTEQELAAFVEGIVKDCAAIADDNHANYIQYGQALALVMLQNSGDLIRQHWAIDDHVRC